VVTPEPSDPAHTDAELLQRVAARDEQALGELYDRYAGMALALAYRVLQDHGQAEDVVQDAFVSVWRRAGTFDLERGSVRGWLMSVVHHAAIDRRRGRFRYERAEVDLDLVAYRVGETDVWDEVSRALDRERVRGALRALPAEQREALELAYLGGLTQAEIAERTGEPLGTVKSRVRLGLRRLERLLQAP
jgi:RNA polymerase sigma-70 factor (ECF subfamily)